MSTRLVAVTASALFTLGAIVQIWTFQLGLTFMLLGLCGILTSALLLLRSIQRRLMKHDRFFEQHRSLSVQNKSETAKYGSSLMRRTDRILEELKRIEDSPGTAKPTVMPQSSKTPATSTSEETSRHNSAPVSSQSNSTPVPAKPSPHTKSAVGFSDNVPLEPVARELEASIAHMWNELGEITRPDAILRKNENRIREFSTRGQQLATQIADSAILLNKLPNIPPRSPGLSLSPIPNRVLYCVHATPEFHSNGYAIRTKGVAEGLADNGKRVRVVGRPGYPWDVRGINHPLLERQLQTVNGVEYVHLPSPGVDTLPKSQYTQIAADALVREALEFRPSIIHAGSNSQTALIALIAARRLGLPFVYEVRGLWEVTYAATHAGWESTERYALDRDLENLVVSEADSLATITRQLGSELISRGADPARISIVSNSVDVTHMTPLLKDPSYELVPGLKGVPLVGFAGSLVEYEGLDLLIEAMAILKARGIECHAVVAGSGSHERALKELTHAHKLDDRVHFLGRIPHSEVRKLLASLDVVVCPRHSNTVTELVSPIKPLEAFAAGRVVLMSNVEPQLDLSCDGDIAPIFAADDPNALAAELTRLLDDEDLRRDYERRARLWVGDNRTWTEVSKELLVAYSNAADTLRDHFEQRREVKNLADLNVALVDSDPGIFNISAACNTIDIKSDEVTFRSLLSTQAVDVLVIGPTLRPNCSPRDYVSIAQTARSLGIKTIVVSTEDSHTQKLNNELFGLIDHYAVVTNSVASVSQNMDARYSTPTSTILDAFDPHEISPLRATHDRRGPTVLEDSIPPSPVMDIARAHGLTILASADNQLDLSARFATTLRRFENANDLNANVAASMAVLRSTAAAEDRTSAIIGSLGCVELLVDDTTDLDALDSTLFQLTTQPLERAEAGWESIRRHHRKGTISRALTDLVRAAGISVAYRALPAYAVIFDEISRDKILDLIGQTVPPTALVLPNLIALDDNLAEQIAARGIVVETEIPESIDFIGHPRTVTDVNYYEDLLIASRFADCKQVRIAPIDETNPRLASLTNIDSHQGTVVLERTNASTTDDNDVAVLVHRSEAPDHLSQDDDATETFEQEQAPSSAYAARHTVLIAGHDLKFAGGIEKSLRNKGVDVLLDKWTFHNSHDESKSLELLAAADVILCEWGLGNAVWYSTHKAHNQRLVVRAHSQEIKTQYLQNIDHDNVDAYIFVNEIVRDNAVLFHGVPIEKTCIVPNYVDTERLHRAKTGTAAKTIGFVGSVPKSKRIDLAVDIFEHVLAVDTEFRLIIKGKTPLDYPWMKNRPDELAWYQRTFDKIDQINRKFPDAVVFEGHTEDMPDWYTRIGTVLSTSDFESFHYTIADGAASGARPVVLYWPGAELIYPRNWITPTVEQAAAAIVQGELDTFDASFIDNNYGLGLVTRSIYSLLFPDPNTGSDKEIVESSTES